MWIVIHDDVVTNIYLYLKKCLFNDEKKYLISNPNKNGFISKFLLMIHFHKDRVAGAELFVSGE